MFLYNLAKGKKMITIFTFCCFFIIQNKWRENFAFLFIYFLSTFNHSEQTMDFTHFLTMNYVRQHYTINTFVCKFQSLKVKLLWKIWKTQSYFHNDFKKHYPQIWRTKVPIAIWGDQCHLTLATNFRVQTLWRAQWSWLRHTR